MKHILVFCMSLLLALGTKAASVVSPGPSNSSPSAPPFFVDSRVAPSVRYQQVYSQSDFQASAGPQLLITEIGFSGNAFTVDLANVEIWFSSTTRSEGNLSTVFGENLGQDRALAYSGSLHFVNDGTQTFGFRIPLQTPFSYDPQAGNLLMDVLNYRTATFPQGPGVPQPSMFSQAVPSDGTARAISFDVNSSTARFLDTGGLLTLFVFEPIPEPGTLLLLAGFFAVWALVLARRLGVTRRRQL